MPAIHLDAVSFRHSSAVDVLSDVTLHLGPGWTGVVGANGVGKTTLLRLISGGLSPDDGSVVLDPGDAVVLTVPQSVEERTADIDRFAESWDAPDYLMRQRLDLEPMEIERWPTLSPGERKRWQVAAALAITPDVLLLDEPTNHLDVESRELLVGVLVEFPGVGLVVSHDRPLLDELTDRTMRVHGGTAELWGGNYSTASTEWTLARDAEIAAYQHLRREHKKLSRRIADRQRTAETKQAQFKRQQRTSSPKDIDSRSALVQGRFRLGEKNNAKVTAKAVSQQQRLESEIDATVVIKERGGAVFIDYVPSPKRQLLRLDGDLRVGNRTLIRDVDFTVERDSRIWLRGPNGAGKTTLLERLRSESRLDPERVLYLPQEITAAEGAELLAETRRLVPDILGKVMSWVAALGVDPDALLASDQPSPGEVRKLALASGLGREVWLAVLDEPTNHLDLPSVERLEDALAAYPGALVVVTHDPRFAEAIDLAPWTIDDETLKV